MMALISNVARLNFGSLHDHRSQGKQDKDQVENDSKQLDKFVNNRGVIALNPTDKDV